MYLKKQFILLFFFIFVIIIIGDNMNKGKSKNDIFYLIVLVLTLITMVVGITFTYFSLIASEEKDITRVQTGTLSINYIDGKEFNTYALLPIEEPTLNTKLSVYKKEFSVSSDGSLDQILDIYLDIKKNEFTNNALKFAIYDSTKTKLATGHIPSDGKVLMKSGIDLKNQETETFTVLIWLQNSDQDQTNEEGHTFVGGFDITATQIKYE